MTQDERRAAADASTHPTEELSERQGDDTSSFFVAGIGASAGGLEALKELLANTSLRDMAVVVVQHLSPSHTSMLAELLAPDSHPAVVLTALDGAKLERNHVYVIPPGADLAVMNGSLQVLERDGQPGPPHPIDFFLRSLADDRGPLSMGIILSGTGHDGTAGVRAIKAAGGMTLVQDPTTARYDSMPRNALTSGCVDLSLDPRELGREIERIAALPRAGRAAWTRPQKAAPPAQEELTKVLLLVRSKFGLDLTVYKPATVARRVERRMALHKLDKLEDYVRYLQATPEELTALHGDVLITVTRFFRDGEAFEALKRDVLAKLLQEKSAHLPLRVWVPGCATGEEAYSIAISILELLEERTQEAAVQIFATDVDEASIAVARRGIYAENITLDLTPERLARFFVRRDGAFVISRHVRELVVFSRQNLLTEPPFSRLDLICCRNLLIYLQAGTQKNVLRAFHYALRPSGVLFLGSSETVGDAADLFSVVDRKHKIYAKKHALLVPRFGPGVGVSVAPETTQRAPSARPAPSLQALADRVVLEHYGPPGVVVDETLEVVQFRGNLRDFLDLSPGTASLNLLRLARKELQIELKRSVQACLATQQRVRHPVKLYQDGNVCQIELDVLPLREPSDKQPCVLVLFQVREPPPPTPPSADHELAEDAAPLARRVRELEREIELTKEYLHGMMEEKEAANTELQFANEELQSANEELQSTNEELETSKEELQSTNEELTTVNEELTTVNDELHNRMAELGQANDDLHNVLAGVENAVLIIGMDRRIRRYNPAAERLFNLIDTDIGRSVRYVDAFFGGMSISEKVERAIDALAVAEEEARGSDRRWYALRVSPYRTIEHTIRGAIVSLTDIDAHKRATELTRNVGDYADAFLHAVMHPLLIVDEKQRVVWANEAYFEAFESVPEETVGSLLSHLGGGWADQSVRRLVESALAGRKFKDHWVLHRSGTGETQRVQVAGNRIPVANEEALVLICLEPSLPTPLEAPHGTS